MNANADIEVFNKDNILYVPIEAITTIGGKNYVYIKGAGSGYTPGGSPQPGSGTGRPTTTNNNNNTGGKGNSKNEATVSTQITGTSKTGGFSGTASEKINANSSKKPTYYSGSALTEVQVGSNNDTSLEITSGLKEGDMIVLPETKIASTKKSTSTGFGGGRGN